MGNWEVEEWQIWRTLAHALLRNSNGDFLGFGGFFTFWIYLRSASALVEYSLYLIFLNFFPSCLIRYLTFCHACGSRQLNERRMLRKKLTRVHPLVYDPWGRSLFMPRGLYAHIRLDFYSINHPFSLDSILLTPSHIEFI